MGSLKWLIAVMAALYAAPGFAQGATAQKCRAFADETVRIAPMRASQPDEDQAHAMVPLAGPIEQWPTLHWMVRLIYRTAPDKLHAEAVRDCLKHFGKPA